MSSLVALDGGMGRSKPSLAINRFRVIAREWLTPKSYLYVWLG